MSRRKKKSKKEFKFATPRKPINKVPIPVLGQSVQAECFKPPEPAPVQHDEYEKIPPKKLSWVCCPLWGWPK